ncbi:MAG: MotA/TolQ/ExbB proton channel family protein [Gammaproteobacteria bacterium]|nr:MotA/TolQ/ExbB proton channel family protein [Gammaproteobacteria bacterium]
MQAQHLINDFSELLLQGGWVLLVIVLATLLMWWLILERYLFFRFSFPGLCRQWLADWQQESNANRWHANAKRQFFIALATENLQQNLLMIQTLTVVLPLLGLLGTVAGMIATFDVMSVFGTGNIRGMAGGISQALITTMGGLMAALSGYYFNANLQERAEVEKQRFADQLVLTTVAEI